MNYLIRGTATNKNGRGRTVYYAGVDGKKGRAFFAPKINAPRFDKEMADKILSQLEHIDNLGWIAEEDA